MIPGPEGGYLSGFGSRSDVGDPDVVVFVFLAGLGPDLEAR